MQLPPHHLHRYSVQRTHGGFILRLRAYVKLSKLCFHLSYKQPVRHAYLEPLFRYQPVFPRPIYSGTMSGAVPIVARTDGSLIAIIADEDTITGFLLAGVGNVDMRKKKNFLVVDSKTPTRLIEETFKEFTAREEIAVVLISQYIANMIRVTIDSYNKTLPAILEIPSKEHPYDPSQDSILSRVKHMFGGDGS